MNEQDIATVEKHFTQSMPFGRGARYALEAILAYVLYGFFWLLPVNIASNIGGWLGRTIGPKLGVSRKAYNHITLAMPDTTDAQKQQIIIGMWDNLGRTMTEYPHLRKIAAQTEIVNKERLQKIVKSGKPAMIISGHIGNWEIMAAAAKQQCNMDVTVTYRKPNNPWVDRLLQSARNVGVTGHIAKSRKSILEMTRVIKNGGKLGILVDQKFNEGIIVPFFGHDAMTMPVTAQLALKFDCPMYPVRVERLQGTHFRMTILPQLQINDTGDKEQDIQKIMLDIHTMLEDWIKNRPEQWLWLHSRWS